MKKLFILLLLVSSMVACTPKEANVLTILTSSGYPPYEMIDSDGKLIGFDIDLGEALAAEMGYDAVEWVDMDFDGIIASLNSARGDMAIAAMSPDPGRDVLFSINYYNSDEESPFFILTKVGNGIVDESGLTNKIVGVQIGTIQESAINNVSEKYNLTLDPRKDVAQMVQEIIIGRIDFILIESLVAQEFVAQYPALFAFEFKDEDAVAISGNAIALPKNSTLLDAVNAALLKLKENGTINQLIEKWFTE